MARVQVFGHTFIAKPLSKQDNGDWLMEAREHTARASVGTVIRVRPSEILDMEESPPLAPDQGAAALNLALAEERKTITPAADLIKAAHDAAVSVRPT